MASKPLPTTMPFGRYRGTPLRALPPEYLRFLAATSLREPLRTAVDIEFRARADKPQQRQ